MSRAAAATEAPEAPDNAVERARRAAAGAAARAGVTVSILSGLEQMQAAAALWRGVWGRDGEAPVNSDLLRALTHAGNYLSGAFVDGELVGALLGFFGEEDGELRLHSHILGVQSPTRTRGVGFTLKLDQRAWALEHGVRRVSWTFDPLVRANAYFNIAKLGAEGVEYYKDFYGQMPDVINAGDASDRLLARWELLSPRVVAAAENGGSAQELDVDTWLNDGAVITLRMGDDGAPVRGPEGDGRVIVQTPPNIVELRQRQPELARQWRPALREVMSEAIGRGLSVRAVNREGWYLIAR